MGLNPQLTRLIAARRSLRATVHKREPSLTLSLLWISQMRESQIFFQLSSFLISGSRGNEQGVTKRVQIPGFQVTGETFSPQKNIFTFQDNPPLCLLYSNAGSCSQLVKYCQFSCQPSQSMCLEPSMVEAN